MAIERMKSHSVQLPKIVYDYLEEKANSQCRSVSSVIREYIIKSLEDKKINEKT